MFKSKIFSRYFVSTLLCAALLSCSDIDVRKPTVVEQTPKVDTVARKSIVAESGLDSAFYYFQKEVEAKSNRDAAEIKYLRTGKDRYRVEGNRYADSVHYWYLKLHSVAARQ